MDITRKRIINPQRYLYALHPGDKFYIAVPLAEEDYPRLQFYGLLPDSPARIPIPRRAATTLNANGKWKVLRDLPKEKRSFEHDYAPPTRNAGASKGRSPIAVICSAVRDRASFRS